MPLNRREFVGLWRRPASLSTPEAGISGRKGEVAAPVNGTVTGTDAVKDSIRCGSVSHLLAKDQA